MSTIKSSSENLTLNADGSGNDVIIQSNGSTKAIVTAEGSAGIGTSSPAFENGSGLEIRYAGGNGAHLKLTDNASGTGATQGLDLYMFNNQAYIENYENASTIFRNNGAERVRINSNGKVGIGISAVPDGTLHVHTASAGSVTANTDSDDLVVENSSHAGIAILSPDANRSAIQFGHTSDSLKLQIRHDGGTSLSQIISDDPLALWTNGAERLRINSTGAVCIGESPNDWNNVYKALQLGRTASIAGYTGGDIDRVWVTANGYVNTSDGNWQYINTDTASQHEQRDGKHNFFVAPSGTSGATISWTTAMTIANGGQVTMPLQPSFNAYHNGSSYNSGTSVSSLDLDTVRVNVGSHYDITTAPYRFTAPVAGVYKFNYRTIVNGAVNSAHVRMHKNGAQLAGSDNHYTATVNSQWSFFTTSCLTTLAANDYVQVLHTSTCAIHGGDYQSFNGYLIG